MTAFNSASFRLSDPGRLDTKAAAASLLPTIIGGLLLVAWFLTTGSPLAAATAAVGALVILYFLTSRDELSVGPDGVEYRRMRLFGATSVSAPRVSVLGVLGRGSSELRTFVATLVLSGSGLPAGFVFFEALDSARAEAVAQQVADHLGVPMVGEPLTNAGAA
jgi:hypothetical protein